MPGLVNSSFSAQFLLCLSLANLGKQQIRLLTPFIKVFPFLSSGGRLGWAAISDKLGRRQVFYLFTLSTIPLYMSLPYFVEATISNPSVLPVYAFIGSTVAAISVMGGTYAIMPAYEADLFGAKNIGPTHGCVFGSFMKCIEIDDFDRLPGS